MGHSLVLTTLVYFLLATVLNIHVIAQDEVDYRLPNIYNPSHYNVDLKLTTGVFNGTVTTFEGIVDIAFVVRENISHISIHGAVEIQYIELTSSNGLEISTNYTYNNVTEIIVISTNSSLTIDENYLLSINYTGQLELVSMHGLYRSEYINENGQKIYLATTQFQATHARKAFPCFDEPRYKAKFNISITYPTELMALGNTPIEQSTPLK